MCDDSAVAGWARDTDYDGPIHVHVYMDGVFYTAFMADSYRADVGDHAFHWFHSSLGIGSHEIRVYAIGVDGNGAPDGYNPEVGNCSWTGTCDAFSDSDWDWCNYNRPYWWSRQSDTVMVANDTVAAGVNLSYGGTIFQLYNDDWGKNLVMEHGGAAIQLSIWGYEPEGPPASFTVYNGSHCTNPSSIPITRAYSQGAHVTNCASTYPCPSWSNGAPWNPIQAQAEECGWDGPGNDVAHHEWQNDTLYLRHENPCHFTNTHAAAPMIWEEWVTAREGYIELEYQMTYTGTHVWCDHDQEIPAIFTGVGMDEHFYFYGGYAPFTGDSIEHLSDRCGGLRLPGRDRYLAHPNCAGYATEGWWGSCDEDRIDANCLTVATFDDLVLEGAPDSLEPMGTDCAYLSPKGKFSGSEDLPQRWKVYIFPYRYDRVIGSQTVREIIYDLAPASFKSLPRCQGRECGDDDCGGSCGTCGANASCNAGTCECDNVDCDGNCCAPGQVCHQGACCTSDCSGRECGPDGCGGSCGTCGANASCNAGTCECDDVDCDGNCCASGQVCHQGACCTPDCSGMECGPDGCGGSCGTCGAHASCIAGTCECDNVDCDGNCCASGQVCHQGACCTPDCSGRECGPDGCGGGCGTCGAHASCIAGTCECDNVDCDGNCCASGQVCHQGACCTPDCSGRECGPDGCGGNCGTCGAHASCIAGTCECDNVDCDGNCCASGQVCHQGACCTSDCSGRECGPDGCGASCGTCENDEVCNDLGQCIPGSCQPDCGSRECGPDPVCGMSCGNCGENETCSQKGRCECDFAECSNTCCIQGQICYEGDCCTPDCADRECGDDGCGGTCGQCMSGSTCDADGQCVSVSDVEGVTGGCGCGPGSKPTGLLWLLLLPALFTQHRRIVVGQRDEHRDLAR